MSSYTPNVPQSGQSLGQTRDAIRNNFTIIDTDFQVDHVAFDDTHEGKHLYSRYRAATGGPTTASGEATFYSENDGSGNPQIFFRPENIASGGLKYQVSNYSNANIATFGTNTTYSAGFDGGWTFLPGGLIMMYGSTTVSGSNTTIPFPFTFPSGVPFCINISIEKVDTINTAIIVRNGANAPTAANFQVNVSQFATVNKIYWTAIGK